MGRWSRSWSWLITATVLAQAACKPPPSAPPRAGERPPAAVAREAERDREALDAAVEAYVFGYPLVSAELARRAATNVERPSGTQAPMGQLARDLAPPREPRGSIDTLSISAWLDIGAEPWLLSLPEARGRFHVVTIRSAWNDLLDTAGGKGARGRASRLAIVGPGWSGKLPAGVRAVRSSTALVRIDGRVLATGAPADRSEAQAWVERITLLPLGASPARYVPPPGHPDPGLDSKLPVRDQVRALDGTAYFKLLATLLKANPPAAEAPGLASLGHIGLVPGNDWDGAGLDASVGRALATAPATAQERILAAMASGRAVSGWTVTGAGATPSTPLGRAAEAATGGGRELDGVAFTAEVDGAGRPLDGGARRVLRFTRGKGPPAEVLWTLTVYDDHGTPVAGKLGRSQLTSKGKFQYGRDGSLEFLLQADWPKGQEANWLQVPPGAYALVLRLHGPRQKAPSALDGSWKPPAVVVAR